MLSGIESGAVRMTASEYKESVERQVAAEKGSRRQEGSLGVHKLDYLNKIGI